MTSLDETAARARSLGYGLQSLLAADTATFGFRHLWLVCNTGATVQERWRRGRSTAALRAAGESGAAASPGPLDAFCREELGALLGERPHRFLFPHPPQEPPYPLVALLRTAGLHRPSPVMQTLHPRYGSWWAVRAVVALTATEPERQAFVSDGLASDPCRGCAAPCTAACPAGAVTMKGWEWERCVAERLREGSACAEECPARCACPAGAAYRYPAAIRSYHYGVSLAFLREAKERG